MSLRWQAAARSRGSGGNVRQHLLRTPLGFAEMVVAAFSCREPFVVGAWPSAGRLRLGAELCGEASVCVYVLASPSDGPSAVRARLGEG